MVYTYFLQCTQGVKDFPEKLKQCMQKRNYVGSNRAE